MFRISPEAKRTKHLSYVLDNQDKIDLATKSYFVQLIREHDEALYRTPKYVKMMKDVMTNAGWKSRQSTVAAAGRHPSVTAMEIIIAGLERQRQRRKKDRLLSIFQCY